MSIPFEALRRDVTPSSNTVFWNSSDAFAASQANVSFTYQVDVKSHTFSTKELTGLAFTTVAGMTSMITVAALLSIILINWFIKPRLAQYRARKSSFNLRRLNSSFLPFSPNSGSFNADLEGQPKVSKGKSFWDTQTSRLLLCLFLSDLMQAFSGVIQTHWIAIGHIEDNTTCKMQGALLHLGDVSSAIWSTGIAFLTFAHVVLRVDPRDWMVVAYMIFGWTLAVILNIIGPIAFTTNEEWFGIAGGWCFITSSFLLPRIFLHYVPMFIAAFVILVCYSLIALHLRGILTYDERERFGWNWQWTRNSSTISLHQSYASAMSWRVMWYPATYLLLILPDSINRMAALTGHTSPAALWYIGMTLLFSMGWVNGLIYCVTRNVLGVKKTPREKAAIWKSGNGGSSSSVVSPKVTPSVQLPSIPNPALTSQSLATTAPSYIPQNHFGEKAAATFTSRAKEVIPVSIPSTSRTIPPVPDNLLPGTPFTNPFASTNSPTTRTASFMIDPLTPLSQIGLAISSSTPSTPGGIIPPLPSATRAPPSRLNRHFSTLRPTSVPETPSVYSMESGGLYSAQLTTPGGIIPPLPSATRAPPSRLNRHSSTLRPTSVPETPSAYSMESGALYSAQLTAVDPFMTIEEIDSPTIPHSASSSANPISAQVPVVPLHGVQKMDPDRKMSLYPMSVRSTDTDFEFGRTELESVLEHYPNEGWIPIKL